MTKRFSEPSEQEEQRSRRLPELLRTTRIIQIMTRISSQPGQWNRKRLAESFEVSERQITKDLDLIRHGMPIEIARRPGGGYYFPSPPKLPPITLQLPEALAIYLAAQSGRRLAGIPQEDLGAALGRLAAIMPGELRPLLEQTSTSAPTAARNRHREEILGTLHRAIAAHKCVDLTYSPASRPGTSDPRRVDPYAVVPFGYSWHLIGWCHLRRDMRIFKIDRIERSRVSGVSFTPDPRFDINEFLAAGWGITRGTGEPTEEVVLIFSPTAGRWVAEEQWHTSQLCEWLADGSLRFQVTIPVTEEFSRWVLHYGNDCQVVQPARLRAWIATQARALLGRYADDRESRAELDMAAP